MDKEAMLAAQRADPHRIVFTDTQITRALGTLARYKRRRKPTREAAITWLKGERKDAAKREKLAAAARAHRATLAARRATIDAAARHHAAKQAAKRKTGGKPLKPPTPRSRR